MLKENLPLLRTLLLAMFFVPTLATGENRFGLAIVIDPNSKRQAATELEAYIDALEEVQHFKVHTIIDRWGIPDSIRQELIRLHQQDKNPIVGVVLIGDIPVAMVRDAQHLCSAFKMDQKLPWRESSVPSDRFYDDFGLQFDFLSRDSVAPYFYYSLKAEGRQSLKPTLFSGRIRPTDAGGTSRYEKLRAYLRKATVAKRKPEPLKSLFVFTGSGSLSESKKAHIDEMYAMREHFPSLAHSSSAFSYMDYSEAAYIKQRLMNEMMRPELSVALLHHHGDAETQYLSSYPKPTDAREAKNFMLYCYGNRLRRAYRSNERTDSVKEIICRNDDIPGEWLAPLTEHELKGQDSLLNSRMNLTLSDFARWNYRPNCRLTIFDACYNGSFHQEDCIANEYIFQPGHTLVGIGATVNVLQDKWPDRYLGLMLQGLMVGYLNKYNLDLESHVVGDPTFAFLPARHSMDINGLIESASPKKWLKILKKNTFPDLQVMALEQLKDSKLLSNGLLMEMLRQSDYAQVRLQAFLVLCYRNSNMLADAIRIAAFDNFELTQRLAVNALMKNGDPELVSVLAKLLTDPNTSARVAFNAIQAVQFFPEQELLAAVNQCVDSKASYLTAPDNYRRELLETINNYSGRWTEIIQQLCRGELAPKRAAMQANFMKIYLPPWLATAVADYTEQCGDTLLQQQLLQALGWHRMAYQHTAISEMAKRMSLNPALSENVRREALRTWKRTKESNN